MRTVLTIAQREALAMIGTKAFVVTLVLMPVLLLGAIIVLPLVQSLGGGQQRRLVVADATGELLPALQEAAEQRRAAQQAVKAATAQGANDGSGDRWMAPPADTFVVEASGTATLDDARRLEYSEAIRRGDLYALLEIPAEVLDPAAPAEARRVRFVSTSGTLSEMRSWIDQVLSRTLRSRMLVQAGIDPAVVASAELPVEVVAMRPYRAPTPSTTGDSPSDVGGEEESVATLFAPFLMMMLMFVVIFLAAQPMLESAMEEKTNRIGEVLLGCVTATQLMAGKLLGNVAGSMVIFFVYGAGGAFLLNWLDMIDLVPLRLLGWFLVFQIAAVLLFSSIFMAVGASVNQLKEAQSLLLPVWLVLMAPLMVWFVAIRDPNGPLATGLSFFPPSSPLMIILRLGTGATIPWWQPPLAALLLGVCAAAVVVLAGRIYRASLLRGEGVGSMLQLIRRAI